MKTSYQKFTRRFTTTLWRILICAGINSAQAVTPAQIPLYVGISAAKPNIMLMLDSSGSMKDDVTTTSTISSPGEVPSKFSYNCNKAISGGETPPVPMIVNSTGTPRFCKSSTSCSNSNQTSFSQNKCFNNSKYYNVAYFNGPTLAGGPYTGLQLNWYFSKGILKSGSLAAELATTSKRTDIAKQAAKDLVTSLTPSSGSTVRMGLARYNSPVNTPANDGGILLSEIKDLVLTQSTLILDKINIDSPIDYWISDSTPIAETLSDIGKYFAMGETNLTLHPNTTPTTASVDSIFTTRSIKNATGNSSLTAPILGYCQKSFVILVSDGLPNDDRAISSSLRDYSGDCATKNLCDSTSNGTSLFLV